MVTILKAQKEHLPKIAFLFDKYRVFYEQPSDIKAAKKFLEERLARNESILFLAMYNGSEAGFTQLYPTFSSVSLRPSLILNDLYVAESFRKKGIGEALLNHAKNFCKEQSFKGLALETAVQNPAQRLYERLGWKKDSHCFHYFWKA